YLVGPNDFARGSFDLRYCYAIVSIETECSDQRDCTVYLQLFFMNIKLSIMNFFK
ncbi:hypothetical protein L9F63_006873, partial [Diploptera punctata]